MDEVGVEGIGTSSTISGDSEVRLGAAGRRALDAALCTIQKRLYTPRLLILLLFYSTLKETFDFAYKSLELYLHPFQCLAVRASTDFAPLEYADAMVAQAQ